MLGDPGFWIGTYWIGSTTAAGFQYFHSGSHLEEVCFSEHIGFCRCGLL